MNSKRLRKAGTERTRISNMTAPVATQAIAAFRERVTDAKVRSHERLVWIEDRLATTKVVNARVRASASPTAVKRYSKQSQQDQEHSGKRPCAGQTASLQYLVVAWAARRDQSEAAGPHRAVVRRQACRPLRVARKTRLHRKRLPSLTEVGDSVEPECNLLAQTASRPEYYADSCVLGCHRALSQRARPTTS